MRYYEACARSPLAGAPCRADGLGQLLRGHLHNLRFSPDQGVRLLGAWAALRRSRGFNPESYMHAALAKQLAAAAPSLDGQQLQAVAAAAPAMQWPVYRASIPLLHAVSREAVHRCAAGPSPLAAVAVLL